MATDTQRAFEHAADRVSTGKVKGIANADLLRLYGLFSVVRKGTPPSSGPSPYLDPRAHAKWNAWQIASALTQEEALQQYVDLVEELEMRSLATEGKEDDADTGFGNDAAMKGFDMASSHSPGSASQRFDITHWASTNDCKSVRFCLESQGVSPDYRDEAGLTALMRAADRNAVDVIRILIDAGADLNATDGDGQTALHYAALCDHAAAAGMLVSSGADTDFPDEDNASAKDIAGPEALKAIHTALRGEWIDEHAADSSAEKSVSRSFGISISWPAMLGGALAGLLAVGLVARYRMRR